MSKKRGPYRPRDREVTMQLLIDAVGLILAEEGYRGLGVNKVALRAGVDKKNIYNYFESYNNLLKTYIKSKDFWTHIFEKFQLGDSPKGEEVPVYLGAIFQEQFKYFSSEKEMQQFIYWQISQSNILLKEISDEREIQGAMIADLANHHFKDTGVRLPAVLALILGGIYYVVWHADYNKSVVCGLDISEQKDREDFLRTIGQVISWAWEAAGKEKQNQ